MRVLWLAVPVVAAASIALPALPAAANTRARRGADDDVVVVDDERLLARETIGYRKGRPFKLKVVQLGWAEVEVATARAFLEMREAAAEVGIELAIRNGFRPPEYQEWLYQAYREGWGNKAARPGYSNHQSGHALDIFIETAETFAWLEANARRYGFKRTVRSEPWHWEYSKKRHKKRARKRHRSR